MFDTLPDVAHDPVREAVERFFFDHGHDLAEAARLLGGAPAEARVVACGQRLAAAPRVDGRIRRDLRAFHRLLALDLVGDPDLVETALLSDLDPASPQVELICRLTEWLEDLIEMVDASRPWRGDGWNLRIDTAA